MHHGIQFDDSMVIDSTTEILPNGWYTDPRAFELEEAEITARTWQYVGPAGLVAKPGRYMTATVGKLPVVITRDKAGELHAVANVCQHRGSTVMKGTGHCNVLKCPYHGWTYDLDGKLQRPLGLAAEIDHEEFSLPKLRVAEWGPLVFVAPLSMEQPLDHFYGGLHERLSETGLKWDSLRLFDRRSWEIKANWKVVTENYIECYHCGHVHPEYSKYVDMSDYLWEYGDYYEAQSGPAHEQAFKDGYLSKEDAIQDGVFVHVWPNAHLQVYPGDANNLSMLVLRPIAPDRTLALLDHYFGEGATEDECTRITEMFSQQLVEDWGICERVHEGLISGAYRAGRLGADDYRAGCLNLNAEAGRTEEPIRRFHKLLYRNLTERGHLSFANGNGNGHHA
jgi:choline monooxygenase